MQNLKRFLLISLLTISYAAFGQLITPTETRVNLQLTNATGHTLHLLPVDLQYGNVITGPHGEVPLKPNETTNISVQTVNKQLSGAMEIRYTVKGGRYSSLFLVFNNQNIQARSETTPPIPGIGLEPSQYSWGPPPNQVNITGNIILLVSQ